MGKESENSYQKLKRSLKDRPFGQYFGTFLSTWSNNIIYYRARLRWTKYQQINCIMEGGVFNEKGFIKY